MGILGEYIGRIYDEVKSRPPYVISQQYHFDSLGQSSLEQNSLELHRHRIDPVNQPVEFERRRAG